uniref:Uncharacterized protein n=1 Tax=Globodera rostochiensis TaxID=31243 RepID=A0A914HPI4_GLORO
MEENEDKSDEEFFKMMIMEEEETEKENIRQYNQADRTLRQLLNLLVDKKRAESMQDVVAKADNGGEDALPSLEELLELIKNQRKAMDKKTKSDKDGGRD